MIVKQKVISLSLPKSFGVRSKNNYTVARTSTSKLPVDKGRVKINIRNVTDYVMNDSSIPDADKVPHEFNIPYEFYGSKGPVIVLIGGFQQSSDVWKKYIGDLSENNRVVLLTLPGVGDVEKPSSGIIEQGSAAVTLKEYAFVVDQIIQKRFDFAADPQNEETFISEDQKVNVWSISFGSLVAQTFCAKNDEFNSDADPGRHKYEIDKVVLESMPLGFNDNLLGILERGKKGEATYEDILGFGQNLNRVMKKVITRQFTNMSPELEKNVHGYMKYLHDIKDNLYEEIGIGKADVGSYYMILGKNDRIVDTAPEDLMNYAKLLSGSDQEPEMNSQEDRISYSQGNVRVTSLFKQAHFGHIEDGAEDFTASIYEFLDASKATSSGGEVIQVDFKNGQNSTSSSTTGTEFYQTQTSVLEFKQVGQ